MGSDSGRLRLKPGKIVQKAGIYRVLHEGHRPPHDVTLRVGDVLPVCRICGERLRFELLVGADGGELPNPPGKKV